MGKLSSVIQYRGKVGNLVGYKVTNAAKEGTIGLRTYVSEIANPRTLAQASQRMRMKPAVNFYSGLADILDHSWEGVRYGARSRSKFMQLALTPSAYLIPYVNKGESRFIPGGYPVSLGSVGVNTNDLGGFSISSGFNWFTTFNLGLPNEIIGITWGVFSQRLIDAYPGLRDGDEITFVAIFQQGEFYLPFHTYFVLDTSSLALVGDVFVSARVSIFGGGDIKFISGYNESRDGFDFLFNDLDTVAAAVIVSRHPTRTSTTWLRSTSIMQLSDDFKAKWMSDARFEEARATYRDKTVDLTSDWLLNQADNAVSAGNGLQPATTYDVTNKALTFGGVTGNMAVLSVDGAIAKPVIYKPSDTLFFYGTVNGTIITYADAQKLTNAPTAGSYYTTDELRAATNKYVIDITGISDEPGIETP